MARRRVPPIFGALSRAPTEVPVPGSGVGSMAELTRLAHEYAAASTQLVRNVPGKFPNGRRPKAVGQKKGK